VGDTLPGRNLAGSNDVERTNDFYPTPEWATHALMKREPFPGDIWEPACGKGDMSKVLLQYQPTYSSELETGEDIYGNGGVDFLKTNKEDVANIISNPPFKLAKEFIEHAKENATHKIAMFLKIQFLEGIGRYDFFQDKKYPLKKVWVFSKRVTLYKDGERNGMGTGTMCFAWFVWEKTHKGEPSIGWINDRP